MMTDFNYSAYCQAWVACFAADNIDDSWHYDYAVRAGIVFG